MSELKACPFCKCTEIVAGKDYADGSYRVDCLGCFARIKANSLELAIKEWQSRPIEDGLRADNARLTVLVERLKEDAERLAENWMDRQSSSCDYCGRWYRFDYHEATYSCDHADNCPITLHRALMKELE